ncbi:hypothetical protein PSPO01_11566 [Paraphaeosphaeria sporulosa]
MAPVSGFRPCSTLSGVVHPTRCFTYRFPTGTGSHYSSSLPYSFDETIPKMTNPAKISSRPKQTAGFGKRHRTKAHTHASVPGRATNLPETAAMHPNATVFISSTTLEKTHPSSASDSLHGDDNLPSTTSKPIGRSPDLTDQTSMKIGLAFLGAMLLIIVWLWMVFFGLPKYRRYLARRGACKEAEPVQGQWWDWVKADREKPWIPACSRNPEFYQVRNLSKTSSAVLGEGAAMSPLRASGATTLGSWPIQSMPDQFDFLKLSTAMYLYIEVHW